MMSASCVFCLFLAILTLAGAANNSEELTCQQCSSPTDCRTCTVQTKDGGCVTELQENTLGDRKEATYSKSCSSFGITSVFFAISLGEGKYLKSNITFCSEDKCNSNDYPILANTTLNGRECPTCFSNTSISCKAKTVLCTGLETYCVSAYGLVTKPVPPTLLFFAAQGCATETVNNFHAPLQISLPHGSYSILDLQRDKAPLAPTTPAPTTSAHTNGSQTLKSISFIFLLSGFFWMLLVKAVS